MVRGIFVFFILLLGFSLCLEAEELVCPAPAPGSFAREVHDFKTLSCEAIREVCLKEVGRDPDLRPYIRTCDSAETATSAIRFASTCLSLVADPTLDAIQSLFKGLAQAAKNNLQATADFISACEQSEDVRQSMVQIPIFNGTLEQKIPCATLVTEFQEWAAREEQDRVLQKILQKPKNQKWSGEEEGVQSPSPFVTIFQNQRRKFQCLNAMGVTYLTCYSIFSVVDPLMAFSLVTKAPQLFKAFRASSAESSVSRSLVRSNREAGFPLSKERGLGRLEAVKGHPLDVLESGDHSYLKITIHDPRVNFDLGSVSASYTAKTRDLNVSHMRAHTSKEGVGSALMESLLRRFPETKTITTPLLADENWLAVKRFKNENPELSLEEAIKHSPAYKIRAQYGFTEIVPGSVNASSDTFGFVVRKPTP